MTTIRPSVFPQQAPPGGPRDDAGRAAAQRAFFQAVMGQAATAQAPAAPTPAAAQATDANPLTSRVAQTTASEAPQKILRPGSLLDIRV